MLLGCLMHHLQRHAGFERDRAVHRIDRLDAVHPLERQADLVRTRDAAAYQAGEPAHGDDGLARRVASREDFRNLLRVRGSHDRERLAWTVVCPAHRTAADVVAGEHVFGTDDAPQGFDQVHVVLRE